MKAKPVQVRRVIHIRQWETKCEECKQPFLAERRGRARFCSVSCQYRAWSRVHRPRGKRRKPPKAKAP